MGSHGQGRRIAARGEVAGSPPPRRAFVRVRLPLGCQPACVAGLWRASSDTPIPSCTTTSSRCGCIRGWLTSGCMCAAPGTSRAGFPGSPTRMSFQRTCRPSSSTSGRTSGRPRAPSSTVFPARPSTRSSRSPASTLSAGTTCASSPTSAAIAWRWATRVRSASSSW